MAQAHTSVRLLRCPEFPRFNAPNTISGHSLTVSELSVHRLLSAEVEISADAPEVRGDRQTEEASTDVLGYPQWACGGGADMSTPSGGGPANRDGWGAERFLALSVALTGFDATELKETGMAEVYRAFVRQQVDPVLYRTLVDKATDAQRVTDTDEDGAPGELARAICQLWYLGVWPGLPDHQAPTPSPPLTPFLLSADAYAAGLVWRCFGGHPPGAARPGYGSWALPPSGSPQEQP